MGLGRKSWLRYRVILYAVIAVAIFTYRNQFDWSRLTAPLRAPEAALPALVIAGPDLAPELVDALVAHFQRDYPDLAIRSRDGGTNQGLEDLLNLRADVAFLSRPPSVFEQDLFRQVDGDSAIVARVGVGGIIVLAGADALNGTPPTLTTTQLGDLMAGKTAGLADRFYATDPNLGSWAATARLLDRPTDPSDTTTVIYLADSRAVARAVAGDPQSLGMILSYDLPADSQPLWPVSSDAGVSGPRVVALAESAATPGVAPTYENLAAGDYPLYVPLLVACRANGGIQGNKFVTHLVSARGQRQVERAGCVPARQFLREIILTNDPPIKEQGS